MKAQRAFGVGRAAVHPEHRVEHPPDRADAVDDELARDLVRQVGQPTLTIGLPEPARAVRFEFGDEPAGEAAFTTVHGAFVGDPATGPGESTDARRVGKERVRTGISWWAGSYEKEHKYMHK